jgi:hypothetical protein
VKVPLLLEVVDAVKLGVLAGFSVTATVPEVRNPLQPPALQALTR